MTREQILGVAAMLVDSEGLGALNVGRLAQELHIKAPSLYRHFPNIDAVREAVAARALADLIDLHKDVGSGRTGRDGLFAVAHAQRTYAQARPGRYLAAAQASPAAIGVSTLRQSHLRLIAATIETYHIDGETAMEVTRGLAPALQGFIMLELNGGVGTSFESDVSFQRLLEMLDAGARAAARSAANRRRGVTRDAEDRTPDADSALDWRSGLSEAPLPATGEIDRVVRV